MAWEHEFTEEQLALWKQQYGRIWSIKITDREYVYHGISHTDFEILRLEERNFTLELEKNNVSPEELMRVRSVQGFEYSGMGNVIHVAEHLSYHVGQIAFLTKVLKDKDLGFYAGQNLNVKNVL